MPSQWNMFVKKIYEEGKAKDSNYEFKQALKDASKRKSEMGQSSKVSTAAAAGIKKSKTSKKRSRSRKSRTMSLAGGRKSRRRRH